MAKLNIPIELVEDEVLVPEIEQGGENSKVTFELVEDEKPIILDNEDYTNLFKELEEEGLVDSSLFPDDIDTENFDIKQLGKAVRFTLNKQKEDIEVYVQENRDEVFTAILDTVSDTTRQVLEYELSDPDPDSIVGFHRSLLYQTEIKNLNPKNTVDAEEIFKLYGKHNNWSTEKINKKITDYKKSGILETEAEDLKPDLDIIAEKLAKSKIEEQEKTLKFEEDLKALTNVKLQKIFEKGDVFGIPLNRKTAETLHTWLIEGEKEVVIKGKKITVPIVVDALMHHKTNGHLERVAAAIMIMEDPDLFFEHFERKVKTVETNKIIKESRFVANKTNNKTEESKSDPVIKRNGLINMFNKK